MLTPKQEKFCQEVVKGRGISDAYRAAYDAGGMKNPTINRNAKALMDDNKIATRIDELRQPAIESAQISAKAVLERLDRIATVTEAAEKYGDAIRANELLGKHLKLFTDKTEHSGPDGGPIPTSMTVNFISPK